jgi:hypothetical protein
MMEVASPLGRRISLKSGRLRASYGNGVVVMAHESRRGSWRDSNVNEKPCVPDATAEIPGLVGLGWGGIAEGA